MCIPRTKPMPQANPTKSGQLVKQMRHGILEGERNIAHIPSWIEQVIDNEAWRFRLEGKLPVTHDTFRSFVETAPLQGMGWNDKASQKMIKSLLRERPD